MITFHPHKFASTITGEIVPVDFAAVAYMHDGLSLQGYLACGEGDHKRPGVVMFPDFWGPTTAFVQDRAVKLAAQGHVVLVADMYGASIVPTNGEEAGRAMAPLVKDRTLLRARARIAMDQLAANRLVDASRVAAMGYCFGGCCALELARDGAALRGAISIHGALETPMPARADTLHASILALHGAEDPMVTQDQVTAFMNEMREAKADWNLVQYGGAKHGFSNPENAKRATATVDYHERTDRRAQRAVRHFLAEVFL